MISTEMVLLKPLLENMIGEKRETHCVTSRSHDFSDSLNVLSYLLGVLLAGFRLVIRGNDSRSASTSSCSV